MPRMKTTVEFISEGKAKHKSEFNYSEVDYKGADHKVWLTHLKCNHRFLQAPHNHLRGNGCPKCAKTKKTTKEFVDEANKMHGINVYDYTQSIFVFNNAKLWIRHVKCGSTFQQTPRSHLSGHGCPKCARKKSINEFVDQATKIHGIGVYDYSRAVYVKDNIKLTISHVVCGFTFDQYPTHHIRGHGCPKCAGRHKTTDEFVTQLKIKHGEAEYDYSEVVYKKSNGHIWITHRLCGYRFSQVASCHLKGSGCPNCWSYKSERVARNIFERLLGASFPKANPKCLERLQLDGYNDELKIAFEYQGQQHEHYVPHFHRNGIEDFYAQRERDQRKIQLCNENGIRLIVVPSKYKCYNPEEMQDFIRCELIRLDCLPKSDGVSNMFCTVSVTELIRIHPPSI